MSYPIKSTFVKRIHFLHGAVCAFNERLGTVLGKYILHYADGAIEERPIVIGEHVLDVCATPPKAGEGGPTVAWSGSNEERRRKGRGTIQLYRTTWENPRPGVEVVGLDFVAVESQWQYNVGEPFLVAITVE